LNVEVRPGVNGHNREHEYGVEHEPPLDTLPSAMGRVKQRGNALEEQYDDDS